MKLVAGMFDVELGWRLRVARQATGLSLQKAGDSLGVTYQQVQKYEQGTDRISVAALVRLAELYGVALEQLLPGSNHPPHVSAFSRQAARLVRDFESIPSEKVRGYLAAVVRSLAAGRWDDVDRPAGAPSRDRTGAR